MPRAWRIVKERYARTAFDGEGARLHGGRWNSPGVAMVYLAESRALALLEILVHVGGEELLARYVLFEVAYENRHCRRVGANELPADWASFPVPPSLQQLGDRWALSGDSVLLSVPSVVVPDERNLLLNPGHRDFRDVRVTGPYGIPVDQRLRRKGSAR